MTYSIIRRRAVAKRVAMDRKSAMMLGLQPPLPDELEGVRAAMFASLIVRVDTRSMTASRPPGYIDALYALAHILANDYIDAKQRSWPAVGQRAPTIEPVIQRLKDLNPEKADREKHQRSGIDLNEVLVIRWLGQTIVLDWIGWYIHCHLEDVGREHILDNVDPPPSDGLWICECFVEDDGPSDWDSSKRDTHLGGKWRLATSADAKRYKEDCS